MRFSVKAFLLSAFVFPGLGQLYKQDRKKGVLLLVAANLLLALLLLVTVMVLSQEYMTSIYPAVLNAENFRGLLKQIILRPLFYLPAAFFLAIWGFSAMDAALAPNPPQEDKS